ncbi:hypothetical protein [Pseudogemmobacter blasticus]|uniref:Uncharacterized protein n=1 Tax=Fuscovulum blasticum DSM 2131 TaxID=1188250 RepID=A0A2T4JCE9_FUSBL|nr:hypothetical protein [Fuscovulum blasticum]PTE15523.1 hypothetical protein C5F44_03840 [Fuscovulum blasticum DSM 2131]
MLRFSLLALSLVATAAAAGDLPADVQALVDEAAGLCDGTVELREGAVSQADLNGDGTDDWVVDTGAFSCPTTATLYCGSAGCGVTTLIDGQRGDLLLHDWGTVTDGGQTYLTAPNDQGETVRFLWTGRDWQLQ